MHNVLLHCSKCIYSNVWVNERVQLSILLLFLPARLFLLTRFVSWFSNLIDTIPSFQSITLFFSSSWTGKLRENERISELKNDFYIVVFNQYIDAIIYHILNEWEPHYYVLHAPYTATTTTAHVYFLLQSYSLTRKISSIYVYMMHADFNNKKTNICICTMYVYVNPISCLRLDIRFFIDCGVFVWEYVYVFVENTHVCRYSISHGYLAFCAFNDLNQLLYWSINARSVRCWLFFAFFVLMHTRSKCMCVCARWFDFNFIHSNHIIDTCTLGRRFCSI